jgi:hypothetical protein
MVRASISPRRPASAASAVSASASAALSSSEAAVARSAVMIAAAALRCSSVERRWAAISLRNWVPLLPMKTAEMPRSRCNSWTRWLMPARSCASRPISVIWLRVCHRPTRSKAARAQSRSSGTATAMISLVAMRNGGKDMAGLNQ